MPKSKKKSSKSGGSRTAADPGLSDDEGSVFNDCASMDSYTSEASTVRQGELSGGEAGEVDESSQLEIFEGKMREAIDLAGSKSAVTRVKALTALSTGFLKRYSPEFWSNQQVTVCDLVSRSVKKGKGGEVVLAARMAVLLALQLPDCDTVYSELRSLLTTILADRTSAATSRAAAANSLAGLTFLGGGEIAAVVQCMDSLEDVFSGSFMRKDGVVPGVSAETASLHAAALSAWGLLLSLLSSGEVARRAGKWVANMTGLLHSPEVELRITAGENIALILEFAFDHDEEYHVEGLQDLLAVLRELATDSSKSKSKKDRKEQRSSFRDIFKAVEEGDCPNESIRFGRESLYLDCWYKKLQYEWFCKVLGTGMNLHLSTNFMLREIFELGAPLNQFDLQGGDKPSKSERNAANQLAFKIRTQSRGKNRDKRSAVV